jgi:O-succinylhomoserine sulfhydrylase
MRILVTGGNGFIGRNIKESYLSQKHTIIAPSRLELDCSDDKSVETFFKNNSFDVVIHSATKYLDGQGRVVGGAIVGSNDFIMGKVFPYVRTAGPTLSAFNAWVFLKGLETLELRMKQQSQNALALAQWLEKQPGVERVYHPGLKSHPQHALAKRQQKEGGAILSFELKGGKKAAFRLINQTKLCSITANLGDTRTTITNPATTTHCRVSPEARKAAGISDGLVRIAVGLENINDLKNDLVGGFKK